MTAVGIDFGTTNCSVATWTGRPEVLDIGLDRPSDWAFEGFEKLLPSVFAAPGDERLFGWPAKSCAAGGLQAVKRLLADNETMHLHGRTFSCRHVAALLFGALRSGAEKAGVTMDTAVVTVPSDSTGQARFRTRQAAGMAGIKVAALINEPTAAALAWLHEVPETERLLVFDWGGGTIDVTVLGYENGLYQELASHGVQGLGGLELDRALERALADAVRIDEFRNPEDRRRFQLEIERTKIRLSSVGIDDAVEFLLPDGREVAVTRRAFEREAQHYVLGTLEPLERCFKDTGLDVMDLDAVLMVGGSSHLPFVRDRLQDWLGRHVEGFHTELRAKGQERGTTVAEDVAALEPVAADVINPLTIVAEGAALAAAALNGEVDVAFNVISNHDLGTRTKVDGVQQFSRVIPRGAPLPYRTSKRYKPNQDFAEVLDVQVWEGNAGLRLDHASNVKLADLTLRPDRPRTRDDSVFELEYQYDVDGILHVTARHLESGRVLLDDAVDFFQDGLGAIDPEISDVTATFAPVEPEVRPAVGRAGTQRPTYRVHAGPVFVVDGSNLACEGRDVRGRETPSYHQLTVALDQLKAKYPGTQVIVVVDASLQHRLSDEEKGQLAADVRTGRVIQTPAGTVGAGDALILDIAHRRNAQVVSNDAYRDFQDRYPWLTHGRLLGAARVGDDWFFNPRKPPRPKETQAPTAPVRITPQRSAPRPAAAASLPTGWDTSHWWSGE